MNPGGPILNAPRDEIPATAALATVAPTAPAPPTRTNPAGHRSPHTRANKAARALWAAATAVLFRPTPWFAGAWRTWLLRRFGARIGYARLDRTARVWAPWRLTCGNGVWVDERVYLYNPYGIRLGDRVSISLGAFLCSASHDYTRPSYPLSGGEIVVEDDCWIAADAFVGPGVRIGRGSVVAARAVVVRDVPPWSVVAGNPARVVKQRRLVAEDDVAGGAAAPGAEARPSP